MEISRRLANDWLKVREFLDDAVIALERAERGPVKRMSEYLVRMRQIDPTHQEVTFGTSEESDA